MLSGSLVAIVTPMQPGGALDFPALARLIDFHIGQRHVGNRHRRHDRRVADGQRRRALPADQGGGRARGRTHTGHRRHRRQLDGGSDRAHALRERRRRRPRACRSCRTTTSRRRKGCTGISETIAEAVDLPMVLYNVPSRTVADLANETVLRLAEIPGIVGMKDATSDLVRLVDMRSRLPAGARLRAVFGQRRHGARRSCCSAATA